MADRRRLCPITLIDPLFAGDYFHSEPRQSEHNKKESDLPWGLDMYARIDHGDATERLTSCFTVAFEIDHVFVRLNNIAGLIVNLNHSIM